MQWGQAVQTVATAGTQVPPMKNIATLCSAVPAAITPVGDRPAICTMRANSGKCSHLETSRAPLSLRLLIAPSGRRLKSDRVLALAALRDRIKPIKTAILAITNSPQLTNYRMVNPSLWITNCARWSFVKLAIVGLGLLLAPNFLQAQNVDFLGEMFSLTAEQRQQLQSVEVPFAQERDYGLEVLAAYKRQLMERRVDLLESGRDVQYLQKLVARIHPLMRQAQRYSKIKVHLVASEEIDARSCPGGFLFFSQGLLEIVENEAALMGIVGHELSHLDRGHQLKVLQHQQLARRNSNPPWNFSSQDFEQFFEAGKMMLNIHHPFHPQEEAEADRDAVEWLVQLGYDPEQLAKLFGRLAAIGPGAAGRAGVSELMPSFMQTHPTYPDRAAKILQQIPPLGPKVGRAAPIIGVENLAARRPADLPQPAPARRKK